MKNLIFGLFLIWNIPYLDAQYKNGQNGQPLDGKYTEYNKDKSVYSEKYFIKGRRIGTWTIHKHDSSIIIGVFENDILLSRLMIGKYNDTLIHERFEYVLSPENRPLLCNYYVGTKLKTKTILSTKGRDSIVEIIDSTGNYLMKAFKDSLRTRIPGRIVKPEFKINLMAFIADNMRYPQSAKEYEIEGETNILFIVRTDGSVSDLTISRSSGDKSLDQEAMRLIRLSTGMWIPATQDGFPANSYCMVTINFMLD